VPAARRSRRSYPVHVAWSVRTGQLSDIDSVLRFWAESGAEPTHTDDVAGLSTLMTHDPSALIVAEEDGSIVGSVIAAWDGWRGSIYRLVVAPSHRRRGLGRQLLGAADTRLATVGAVRVQAIVVETEPKAIGFWGESGWERQVDRARFVRG
jgi:ribosomal protein S18 acetylase RimI-like enzyme